jgi:uncharacterized membrane protein (UPF0136 family)
MSWLSIVVLLYGLAMLGGGFAGYKIGHSLPSLLTGIISGVLLFAAAFAAKSHPRVAYGLASLVTLALIVVFIKRQTEAPGPRNIGLIGLSVAVLACLVIGHFIAKKP